MKSNRTRTWLWNIRIDPGKEYFHVFRAINEIFRNIRQSTKKTPTSKISTRLLGLEFQWNNIIKSKAIRFSVKKVIPDYNKQ